MAINVETFHSKIAGTTFYDVPWNDLHEGDQLLVQRDPLNQYDSNAIKLLTVRGVHIGHLAAVLSKDIAPLLDEDRADIMVSISAITGGQGKNNGINIEVVLTRKDLDSLLSYNPFAAPEGETSET